MNGAEVLDFARESVYVLMKLSFPLLLTSLVVGLIIALFQTLTQLQESTLTFVPKIIVIFILVLLILPSFGDILQIYVDMIMDKIISFGSDAR